MSRRFQARRGFSLVELLVVIAIIAVLMALLFPAFRTLRYKALAVQCKSNLRGIYEAVTQHAADYRAKPNPRYRMPELAWRFANGSSDYPHESGGRPGTPARALFLTGYVKDPSLFFCPLAPINAETHFNPAPPHDFKTFHGTYTWSWRTILPADDTHAMRGNGLKYVSDPPREVLYYDALNNFWVNWVGRGYRYEHYNALFLQGDVREITRTRDEMAEWLWGPAKRPY